MCRTFILLLACCFALGAAAKGRFWQYSMHGTAYDKATNDVLRNTALIVGKQLVTTDSLGRYTVIISGVTCDKGTSWQIRRCNEKAYGELVVRRALSVMSITIASRWRRYAFCVDSIVPCKEQRRDLYVP